SDKPSWFQKQVPMMTAEKIAEIDNLRLLKLRSLLAVDEAIDAMLTLLDQAGVLKNTVIIYTSDNSEFWGEHRLQGKGLFYEEAVRVPLVIRYPKFLSTSIPRVESRRLVANIDIAPTIYELAGVTLPSPIDGRSLVPLFSDDPVNWRKELFLEGWPDTFKGDGSPTLCSPPYTAIRTERYTYAETHPNKGTDAACSFARTQRAELYDLKNDPFQIDNLEANVKYQEIRAKLKNRLDAYGYVEFPQ
ncbi:MAG TPA: sulfatase/phosphatase domain-containing protein, partial [Acidobacteriota bacterium]